MSDSTLTAEERAEIAKRKPEMTLQKKTKQSTTLDSLKKELGVPPKGTKKLLTL